jgi:SAM-dependent methyltransferase
MGDGWTLCDGPALPAGDWAAGVYRDKSLLTQVGTLHADHAGPDDHPAGRPTSSSTMPGLLVQMYRHAMISDSTDVLDVGTGTGYGTALLTQRLGEPHVTSIDVDSYLVKAATERLYSIGLHPATEACDATGPLPGGPERYDRIIATRSGPGYPPAKKERLTEIRRRGDQRPLPRVNVSDGWELYSTLGLILPGVQTTTRNARTAPAPRGCSTRTSLLVPQPGTARNVTVGAACPWWPASGRVDSPSTYCAPAVYVG